MRLERISIRNFRLLRRFTIELAKDKPTTILVGPNNSGKTSVMEALALFLGSGTEGRRKFSIHDFAHATRNTFSLIEKRLKTLNDEDARIELLRKFAPKLRLELLFRYADEAADIVVANDLLMTLNPSSDAIGMRIEYALENAKGLLTDFKARRNKEQTLFQYLIDTLPSYYKIATFKISEDGKQSQRLDRIDILGRLIKVDIISAQRHMDDEDNIGAAKISRLLHDHYNRYYKLEETEGANEIEDAIKASSEILTKKYGNAFQRLTDRLKEFGYPQGHASPDLLVKAEMTSERIYRDNTKVYYASKHPSADGAVTTYELPEKYNGLGYKNLIFIVLQLESFRSAVEAIAIDKPRVHIVALEEPEAHLHPQMQNVFINEISKVVADKDGVTAQIVLSTHSSHMVVGSEFDPIRYFKRTGHEVVVKDLSKLDIPSDSNDEILRFLKRYVKSTHCELFFADKIIFVEGQVERILLPLMVVNAAKSGEAKSLASQYLSISEIGGGYAHIFKPLIDFIQVPTLVITDIDAVDEKGEKCPVANGKSTSNAALKDWIPAISDLTALKACDAAAKTLGSIQVAYQVEEGGGCGRSFEEAFLYGNAKWLADNSSKLRTCGKRFSKFDENQVTANAYDICRQLPKVDFALDLIAQEGWATPKYIADGLKWLSEQGG